MATNLYDQFIEKFNNSKTLSICKTCIFSDSNAKKCMECECDVIVKMYKAYEKNNTK